MKRLFVLPLLLAMLLMVTGTAQDKKAKKETTPKAKTETTVKKAAWNKICPVMGEDVDPEIATVTYKDKTIGFCCKKCIAKFEKDPEKYMQILSEDGTKLLKKKG